jgi:hypothetical protein
MTISGGGILNVSTLMIYKSRLTSPVLDEIRLSARGMEFITPENDYIGMQVN